MSKWDRPPTPQEARAIRRMAASLARVVHGRAPPAKLSASLEASMRRAQPMLDDYRAAKKLDPEDPKRKIWERTLGSMTPAEALQVHAILHQRLPPRKRGRPEGTGRVANDSEALKAVADEVADGVKPTTAARKVYESRGHRGDLKGRADSLRRVFKKSANKSTD